MNARLTRIFALPTIALVSLTLPPNSATRVAIRRSSVATMTRETTGEADARR